VEISEFFKAQLKDPFNKYCIDCKKKKTTHALVWLGIYVCEGCSRAHYDYNSNATMSSLYVKEIMKEQWDDYQLKSMQLGGNKALFEFMKEYEIHEFDNESRYRHKALGWY
jgi:hypothetical protein